MPLGCGGAVGVSGLALGWECRPMWCGIASAHRRAGQADLDAGQVERVEHQLDFAPDQGRVDLVGVAVQRHGGGLGDAAVLLP